MDYQDNVQVLTDGSGVATNTYTYDAYGKTLTSTGSMFNSFWAYPTSIDTRKPTVRQQRIRSDRAFHLVFILSAHLLIKLLSLGFELQALKALGVEGAEHHARSYNQCDE
jgi:hypothetical protein